MKIWYTITRTEGAEEDEDGTETGTGSTQEPTPLSSPRRRAQILVWAVVCCTAPVYQTRSKAWRTPRVILACSTDRRSHCTLSYDSCTPTYSTRLVVAWVQCHFDAVIAHEKAIIPYPTPPIANTPRGWAAQNLPNDFAAALFFDTRSTLKRTVFDSGRH